MPPDRQRMFMVRRLGAVAVGILILILLVLGIRGCLNARKERAFENYARDLGTLADQSNQLSQTFFGRFDDPGNLTALEFETEIRADRSTAEGLVSRAESLDPPGELDGAQEDVVTAFELRRDGLAGVADNIGAALGDEDREEALAQISAHMSDFLASDVLYTRGRDQIDTALKQEGINEEVPESNFFPREPDGAPDLEWLDETAINENLSGIKGAAEAAPGLHDLAISSVLVNGTDVSPDVPNTVGTQDAPEVEVTLTNEGDTEETDVPVTVAVSGAEEPTESEQALPKIAPGEAQTVKVPLDPAPPTGTAVTLEVSVEIQLGEEDAEDNEFSYEVTFE